MESMVMDKCNMMLEQEKFITRSQDPSTKEMIIQGGKPGITKIQLMIIMMRNMKKRVAIKKNNQREQKTINMTD